MLHDLFDPDHLLGALMLGAMILAGAIFAAKLLAIWGRRLGGQPQPLIDPTVISFLGRLLQVICFVAAAIIYAAHGAGAAQVGGDNAGQRRFGVAGDWVGGAEHSWKCDRRVFRF